MKKLPEQLRRIAQNDYMVDGAYLPDGEVLLEAANAIDSFEDQMYARDYAESMERSLRDD